MAALALDIEDARSTGDSTGAGALERIRSAANAAMDRYADGDDAAFATLYDLLAPRLYAFAFRQLRSAAATEDVIQQAMLQMHCARESFVSGADVIPWAYAITRRLVIDGFRRARHRERLVPEPDYDSDDGPASTDGRPDDILYSKQLAERMERALMALPEAQRVAFQLMRFEGLSAVDAAAVLDTTPNAVKLRAHRTDQALRLALKEGGVGGRR